MTQKLAVDIANFLSKYQKKEGLIDPKEKRIVKNSYGTEFYALLCTQLFKKTKKKIWKEKAVKALESSLIIRKNRAKIKGIFRWEFKNYALIQTYFMLKNDLDKKLKKQLVKIIKSWKNLYSFETNWFAMRAVNFMLRYREFGYYWDLAKAKSNMRRVLKRQTKEGFFPDDIELYSSQYHAYVLALLYQYYELTRNEKVKNVFLKGIDFMVNIIGSKGDFSFGRGEKQIFGYASMIYALYGASKIKKDSYYKLVADKVLSYVSKSVNKKNNYPIVLKGGKLEAYNHKSDYLPFFACYLLLAEEMKLGKLKQIKKTAKLAENPSIKPSALKSLGYNICKLFFYIKNYICMPKEFLMVFKYRKNHDPR